ncbi:TonB-dependent receptor plug domain-containing protein [Sediminicola luteus]|uniref:TonB-dependent receptor n=1 Tax=Sediminicola luteus TaxID=319238 RepID=A0A2A4G4Q2_9FLAO|nr:TonB-dependent receptor [Sediminicola luteus]PCE62960.1 TonB-dependent receptor [Sediminicola luteus]
MGLSCQVRTFFFLLISMGLRAQQQGAQKDSLDMQELDEVVVTGQISRTSVDKSVFEVEVIGRPKIARMAGNNLADVLNQNLNISVRPSATTGKSGVRLFGLDSQYFKVLVDNIPLINDEGLGNNTDLTQINLDEIERVEIVEGSMGVQYGSNAVTGIINIITKKDSRYTWKITPYLQEETVSDEYAWFDEGRHIQSLNISHNISDAWYASAGYTRNDFAGHYNGRKGEDWPENDGLRGHEWLPKLQNSAKGLLRYRKGDFQAFYKFEYFDERVSRYDSVVRTNYNPATQTTNPTASDEVFTTNRWVHNLNANGKLVKKFDYYLSLSYQEQKRNIEAYTYYINTGQKDVQADQEYESRDALFSRGTLSKSFADSGFGLQLGYEINHINGYSSPFAGSFQEAVDRSLTGYDFFSSAEFKLGNRFALRPGIRAMFASQFDFQMAYSLSALYQLGQGYQLRAVLGNSPRNPNYDELFSYFVDINHDLRGNPDLSPEKGRSAMLHLKKTFNGTTQDWSWRTKFSARYLTVKDRIELIVVNPSPLAYKYNNIDEYTNWGVNWTNRYQQNRFQAELGLGLSATSKVLNSQVSYNDDYLYAFQLNASLGYRIPKIDVMGSLFYKYNGPEYQFAQDPNDAERFVRNKLDGYGWMDASLQKSFLDNRLQLTLGARNLLDVTRVNYGSASGGAIHGTNINSLLLGYGRSYFVKLLYNLNID